MATPINDGVRFIQGGSRTVRQLRERVAAHDGGITVESMLGLPVADAIQRHAAAGLPVRILSRNGRGLDDFVPGARTTIGHYASRMNSGAFMHSKMVVFDRGADRTREPELWLTNHAGGLGDRAEVTAVVRGKVADLADKLIRSSMRRDPEIIGRRVDDAARAGLLVNEPLAARWPYAQETLRIVRESMEELDVAVKEIRDLPMRELLRDAPAARKSIAAKVVERFPDRTTIPHTRLDQAWRTNFVYGDGVATLGTAFFEPYMLGHVSNQRATRDSGLFLGGAAAVDARAAVHALRDDPARNLVRGHVSRFS